MSALWAQPQFLISWYDRRRCKYYALCCSVFTIVVMHVKRRFVLYCSRARMRLRSRNYSVEAFYNDVPECVEMKTFRKTREIHSFSVTISSDTFLCLEGYFHKKVPPNPEVILSYSKHALDLCFITSYTMIRPESDEHIFDCGLLSVWCLIARGAILWYLSTFANLTHQRRCNPSWSENLCAHVPIAYIHPLPAHCP